MIEGLLDKTVAIRRKTRVQDGQGGFTETWADQASVNARIRPFGGDERFSADKVMVFATHRIYLPGDADVAEADRIVYGARTFEVKVVSDVDEQGHHLEVDAVEIT